jgi:hypothetical protein
VTTHDTPTDPAGLRREVLRHAMDCLESYKAAVGAEDTPEARQWDRDRMRMFTYGWALAHALGVINTVNPAVAGELAETIAQVWDSGETGEYLHVVAKQAGAVDQQGGAA